MAELSNQQEQRIGPYRVEERLGVGGMGEVFKAYDDRLQRWVAIKRIRGDKDEGDESRERFQREARATAKLNHATIVHLYDIFHDGDSDCIVMEYVEGVTLDSLIRQGPLEPMQVASLGQDIASGLAEAHAKGIIHRDLKVENIMITPEGHAKILDFGLARPLLKGDLDDSLTGKGQLVGTSRAMSPEYVGGEDIDHRSDLFSLGVLLYEAATSHSPFRAHNTLATLRQVMLHQQTPAYLVNPNVPEELSVIIDNLLEKNPDDRPQSAREVARAFGLISGKLSSGDVERPQLSSTFTTSPTEIFTPTPTSIDLWGRRRWLGIVAALLFLGIGATYFGTRWWLAASEDRPAREPAEGLPLSKRARIVLADFQNHTGEPLLDKSIELVFRLGLEQSRFAYVLPESQVQSALDRMERELDTPIDRTLGIEIAKRESARALVIGAIAKIGETYSVSAEIIDPRTGANSFSTNAQAENSNRIITALEKVTNSIRLNLGESLTAIEDTETPLEKVTTKDLEALSAYSHAVAKIARGAEDEAVVLLNRAIEIDPSFAMAYAKLATAYSNLDYESEKILWALDKARSLSSRLTQFENLYVEGWAARLHGDADSVMRTWSMMSTLYPEEQVGHFNLGMTHQYYFRNYEAAAIAFEEALAAADPQNSPQASLELGYCQIALERYESALENLDGATGLSRDLAISDLFLAKKNHARLEASLEKAKSHPGPQTQALVGLRQISYFADEGDFASASKQALLNIELAEEYKLENSMLINNLILADLVRQSTDRSRFGPALESAVNASRRYVRVAQGNIDLFPIKAMSLIGKMAARAGDLESAKEVEHLISPLVQKTPITAWRSYNLMLQGEILAAQGSTSQALLRFKEAQSIVDSFQVHESLALNYESAGLIDEAITENEWLTEHRGLGVVECKDECQPINVIAWAIASYRLGMLHERTGSHKLAAKYYRDLLDHWSADSQHPVRTSIEQRLSALVSEGN